MKLKKVESKVEPVAAPAVGGATIADRFKLDMPDPSAKKPDGAGAKIAAIAAILAIFVAGFLVFKLWQHWEFLMPA